MKLKIFFMLALCYSAYSQSLSVFNLDASTFPIMKAKFYAFDASGNQITTLSPSDFSVTENNVLRSVSLISCPPVQPPQYVSVALSIDVSGSMSYSDSGDVPVEMGKTTAKELVNMVSMPPSEFALQTCTDVASIINDFTTDKNKILNEITPITAGGSNDFVEQLLNPRTGLLNIVKTGRYKHVAVIYTDAWWDALTADELQRCKDTCTKYNIQFYAIIYSRPEAQPNGITQSLHDICDASGGVFYDGITSTAAAKDLGSRIQQTVQGGDPCEIDWISGTLCSSILVNLDIAIKSYSLDFQTTYTSGSTSLAKLIQKPAALMFRNAPIGIKKDSTLSIIAVNSDFTVSNITSSNPAFSVTPTSFTIKNGDSTTLTVSYTAQDSGLTNAKFTLENNVCNGLYFYASGGYLGIKPKNPSLKLTFPNGGETFVAGNDTNVTWDGIAPTDTVSLEYSTDNGTNWQSVCGNASNLSYLWKNIPVTPSNQCLMKVSTGSAMNDSIPNSPILSIGKLGEIYALAYSPDGLYIAVGTSKAIVAILDASTLSEILTLTGHTDYVSSVAFSADGTKLVSGSADQQ